MFAMSVEVHGASMVRQIKNLRLHFSVEENTSSFSLQSNENQSDLQESNTHKAVDETVEDNIHL